MLAASQAIMVMSVHVQVDIQYRIPYNIGTFHYLYPFKGITIHAGRRLGAA